MWLVVCLVFSSVFHACITAEVTATAAAAEVFDSSKVNFFLNGRKVSDVKLATLEKASLQASGFDPTVPTIIFTHGYMGNHLGAAAQTVKSGFLNASDVNVILVDYKPYNYPFMLLYGFYKDIGRVVGNFINVLVRQGALKLENLTVVGHSFGAHISAIAANTVEGQVPRIIGLDPAGPQFRDVAGPEDILSVDDATEVRCMHTSNVLGISQPICHINYFVNGGRNQPSCANAGEDEVLFGTCSHNVPMGYLARVLNNAKAFPAAVCLSVEDAKTDRVCSRAVGGYMEFPLTPRASLPGSFFVPVPTLT